MTRVFLLFFFLILKAYSQPYLLEGEVQDNQGNALFSAVVLVSDLDKKYLGYAITDSNGRYGLQIRTDKTDWVVEVSFLGFNKIVDTIRVSSQKTIRDYKLTPDPKQLEAVVIKTNVIKDTMRIATENFVLNESSTLRDILDQSDGFVISEEGSISFKGKQINKILINEKEVFVGQNKVALDNLEHAVMKEVQLINNYKDKFKVDFDNFTEMVLNINTKEEFKGVLKYNAEVAGGIESKYKAKLNGFYFSDSFNAFLVSNTNNIGEKELSFKDMPSQVVVQASELFREQAPSFFQEKALSKRAFDSDNSFTIRKQSNRYRLGFIGSYNNTYAVQETELETYLTSTNSLVKHQQDYFRNSGDFMTSSLRLNYLLSENSGLNFSTDLAYLKNRIRNHLDISDYSAQELYAKEVLQSSPKSILNANEIEINTLLNKQSKLDIGIKNSLEYTDIARFSRYVAEEELGSTQAYRLQIHTLKAYASWENRFNSKFVLGAGIELENKQQKIKLSQSLDKRHLNVYTPYIRVRGQNKQMEYAIRVASANYNYKNLEVANLQKIEFSGNYEYNLNPNTAFRANLRQYQTQPDMHHSIDTLMRSYNEVLVNSVAIASLLSTNRGFGIGIYNYNIARSRSYSVSYTREQNKNSLQTVFQSVANRVFYYENYVVDKRNVHTIDLTASKGLYFGEKYNYINFGGLIKSQFSDFPVFSQEVLQNFKSQLWSYRVVLRYEPRGLFFDRISLAATWIDEEMRLDKSIIANRDTYSLILNIQKKVAAFSYEIKGGLHRFKSEKVSFNTPALDLSASWKFNKALDFTLSGLNLMYLFEIGNSKYTGFNLVSDGTSTQKYSNKYNMNYLMLGLKYRP